ncbi:hypothetical protein BD770DRAFT_452606 [Pilaira anomala]|nr:hypothetical protein BD770DRAFT_452606 [Pilaira anomala]
MLPRKEKASNDQKYQFRFRNGVKSDHFVLLSVTFRLYDFPDSGTSNMSVFGRNRDVLKNHGQISQPLNVSPPRFPNIRSPSYHAIFLKLPLYYGSKISYVTLHEDEKWAGDGASCIRKSRCWVMFHFYLYYAGDSLSVNMALCSKFKWFSFILPVEQKYKVKLL